ncbi:sulfotransferase family 2 domain-containing protein [Candidatus Methylocalor cossyra]|uniref:Sulfotransferase family protein n=1 Tax=Candidatus Methylocalor cossyra TaxID=3108543 RepID=A0ABP1CC44_9GAMM
MEINQVIKRAKSTIGGWVYAAAESARWNSYKLRCPRLRAALARIPAGDLVYAMNVSQRYRYVYMDNPKTGCSSLKSALVELETRGTENPVDCYDWTVFHSSGVSPLQRITRLGASAPLSFLVAEGYRFFTFVRNPYTRLLSGYRDKIVKNKPQKRHILRVMGYDIADLQRPISFAEFVKAVVRQTDYEMNPHWRVQKVQILYEVLDYAFVGRFEAYQRDFYRVFELLGIPQEETPQLRHLNRTKEGEREGCGQYYTKELQAMVYERYREDFETFGYGYELPD